MCVSSLPKTVTRQRRDCDLNPGPSAPESSTLTTRLPSHPHITLVQFYTAVARYNVWNSAGVENDTPVYTGVQFFFAYSAHELPPCTLKIMASP